ncbi:MAG TPA: hypothetical protein VFZ37_05040 [Jiangellaceae bacterium]
MNSATNADELATSLQAHYDEVIDREMVRLAHRTPSLEPADLRTVHSALRELVERLVVARVRESPQFAGHAAALFGVEAPSRLGESVDRSREPARRR